MAEADAREWWDALWSSAPPGLRGLWFGLVEPSDGGWRLYVAGTERFDSSDETADWAAYPYAWRPDGDYLPFPDAGVLAASDAVVEAVVLVRALAPWQDLWSMVLQQVSMTATSRSCTRGRGHNYR